ncbi:monocarboxylate transporter 12-like [Ptychodera flava]|uniref:monocarboxylate transporter 12-like n=1 Tax=Ptychodera flava TaxID=63121 RepID=UPI00396A2300
MSAVETKSPKIGDPPDGGWGWFVILATCIMMFFVRGIGTSLAVFYVVFLDYFGDSAAGTSLVLSSFTATTYMTGPFSAFLSKKFGFRKMAMLGGVMASISIAVSSFATSSLFLSVSLGFGTGVSIGLCYVSCFASLGRYFKKRYTMANGIALAGVGLSNVILPPLCQLLIDKYGWRGALLIVSALTAHLCVGAALLRPIHLKADSNEENGGQTASLSDNTVMRDENSESGDNCSRDTTTERRSIKDADFQGESNTMALDAKPCIKSKLTVEQCRSGNSIENPTAPRNSAKDETVNGDNVAEMRTVNRNIFMRFAIIKLFHDRPLFILLVLYRFVYCVGHSIPLAHLVDKTVKMGVGNVKAAFTMSVIGMTSCVTSLITGIILDFVGVDEGRVYIHCLAIAVFGISTVFTNFTSTYEQIMIISVVLGMARGVYMALDMVLTKQVAGVDRMVEGIGVIMFCIGIAFLVGPTLSGYLFDMTGSYDLSFYVAGTLLLASSCIFPSLWIYSMVKTKLCHSTDIRIDKNTDNRTPHSSL